MECSRSSESKCFSVYCRCWNTEGAPTSKLSSYQEPQFSGDTQAVLWTHTWRHLVSSDLRCGDELEACKTSVFPNELHNCFPRGMSLYVFSKAFLLYFGRYSVVLHECHLIKLWNQTRSFFSTGERKKIYIIFLFFTGEKAPCMYKFIWKYSFFSNIYNFYNFFFFFCLYNFL